MGSLNPNPSFSDLPMTTPLHLSFNQDYSRFVVSTASGFRIYTCDPFREFYNNRSNSDDNHSSSSSSSSSSSGTGNGIGHVEMLFNSAYLALVGGGPQPQYPVNTVMIWNAHAGRCIGELQFRSAVVSVKLRRDIIVVVLMNKVYAYNFHDLTLLDEIPTADNPNGLCAVSQRHSVNHDHVILACPAVRQGEVIIRNFGKTKSTEFVLAHESRIACLALSQDGMLLATASSKGTLIRVFSTADRSCLREVRRGADRAEIYSLAFSSTAEWLASSSDKGTVHVFNLKLHQPCHDQGIRQHNNNNNNASEPSKPPGLNSTIISSLSFMKGVVWPRYLRSEWSFAQFRLPEGLQHIVGFGHQKNTILIGAMDGRFYRCQFDPVSGGEMTQLEYSNFLN